MKADAIDPVPLIRQRLAEDILPIGHDYWDVLDLVPPSAEAGNRLHDESARRLFNVAPLQNFVEVYSVLTADIITQVMYKNLTKLGTYSDEQINGWHAKTVLENREIARSAVLTILAHMVDAGVVQPSLGVL